MRINVNFFDGHDELEAELAKCAPRARAGRLRVLASLGLATLNGALPKKPRKQPHTASDTPRTNPVPVATPHIPAVAAAPVSHVSDEAHALPASTAAVVEATTEQSPVLSEKSAGAIGKCFGQV